MSEFVEWPTFSPRDLPSEGTLHAEAETDFQLLEQGLTPDEIIKLRKQVAETREETREYEKILQPYLDKFGVEFESELPTEIQMKLANIRRVYFRGGGI